MKVKNSFFFLLLIFLLVSASPAFSEPASGISGPENFDGESWTPTPPLCPAPSRLIEGICCPADKDYVVDGRCSACPNNQSLVSGQCCPNNKKNVVEGICCPADKDYVVDGKCSACNYYAINFTHKAGEKVSVDTTDAKSFSCFEKIVNQAIGVVNTKIIGDPSYLSKINSGAKTDYTNVNHGTAGWFTSMLWEALKKHNGLSNVLNITGPNKTLAEWKKQKLDNQKARDAISCTGGYQGVTKNGEWQIGGTYSGNAWQYRGEVGCKSGSLYLDENCKFVDADVGEKAKTCGSVKFDAEIATPISLIWSESDKSEPSTVVGFKLDPHSDSNTWLWRGSESLPLLVYDPEHQGVIESATQLFGSWTFGGNGLASLVEGSEDGTPWKNGYEALSVMDKDLDGKVSGEEIRDLGLWFDKNRDGISQVGEVKTLSELSVSSLYYKADKTEKGAILATRGYEREVDGHIVIASSMDWSEKGLKDGLGVLVENLDSQGSDLTRLLNPDRPIYSEHAKELAPEVYGVWGWSNEEASGSSRGSGILSFDPSEEGVSGATITQFGVAGVLGLSSKIMFSNFVGSVIKSTEGLIEIKFQVQVESGALLDNTATLSKDGKQLLGRTIVTGSKFSESGTYEYAWKAEKIIVE